MSSTKDSQPKEENKPSSNQKVAIAKKNATPKKENLAKREQNAAKVEKSKTTINDILNPSADNRIKKLETLNRLAEKKGKIDSKLSELTNFNASNDGTLSKMEFTADNGYKFTISNPKTIDGLLENIENELTNLQVDTDREVLEFDI